MPLQIIRDDITRVTADAIVNTANPQPTCGSGTDSAIYEAAGREKLLAERMKIGTLQPGGIAVTPAFALKARYIIHVCGPIWNGGTDGEFDILRACYERALLKADELSCGSIAFPLMASGVNGFPKDKALQIAISTISGFLMTHDLHVTLVVFSSDAFRLSGRVFDGVRAFIDDVEVQKRTAAEYGSCQEYEERVGRNRRRGVPEEDDRRVMAALATPPVIPMPADEAALDQMLGRQHETFQQCLFRMIDARGLTDKTVYTRANLDRKLFSKIRCKPDYRPKKETAVAFALALHLDLEETAELLSKAGLALSASSRFDIIAAYCISHHYYDISEINAVLYQYDQPQLGV